MTADADVFARVKRFRECWLSDDRFREAVRADPAAMAAEFGLDPAPLEFLWEGNKGFPQGPEPEARALRRVEDVAQGYFDFCADDTGAAEAYRVWRARQVARSAFAQGFVVAPLSLHLPYTIELTRGCSLGCWFCGLSASRLEAVLPTDLDAWEAMLRALQRVFGASAVRGFLYWATDPLDHPDYEAHAEAFGRVLGRFPATTTAAPLADVDRTRRLMALAKTGDCPSLRFSVVSLRQLNDIHAAFSAEELADIDLVPVNRESLLALAEAGHVRKHAERRPDRVALERDKLQKTKSRNNRRKFPDDDEIWAHRTIACVSGFLIEPVAKRIRLISPEPCSDRWPDGYAVFDEARFEDADGFARALDAIVARSMTPEPPGRLARQRGVEVVARGRTRAVARGRGHEVRISSTGRDLRHFPALAGAFAGGAAVEEVVDRIARRFGMEPPRVRQDVTALWRHGVLIETFFAFADAEDVAAENFVATGAGAGNAGDGNAEAGETSLSAQEVA